MGAFVFFQIWSVRYALSLILVDKALKQITGLEVITYVDLHPVLGRHKIPSTRMAPKVMPNGYPNRPKTLGERLKKKRLDVGLYQKDVAKIIGVSTDTVTNWEKGRTKPCRKNTREIELFLDRKK